MKLRTELVVGNATAIILLGIIAGIAYRGLTSLNETAIEVARTHEVISQAHLVQRLLIDMETGERGFLISGDEEFLEPYESGISRYEITLENLKSLVSNDPVQLAHLQIIDRFVRKWKSSAAAIEIAERRMVVEQMTDSNRVNPAPPRMTQSSAPEHTATMQSVAALIQGGVGKRIMDQIRDNIDRFVAAEESLLITRHDQATHAVADSVTGVIVATLLAMTTGFGTMLYVSRSIQRKVGGEPSELAKVTEEIAKGRLDIGTSFKNATGIAASIEAMASSLKKNNEVMKEQDWLKTSIAHLHNVMRRQTNISNLSKHVVSEITRRLDGHLGIFYLLDGNEDEKYILRPIARYAHTSFNDTTKEFKRRESLIGQCVLEKQQLFARNIPKDYIKVTSGLGAATPNSIIVTPCLDGDLVRGVIEIGSLGEITELHAEYLNLAASAFAVGLKSVETSEALARQNQALLVEISGREQMEEERRELESRFQQAKKLESLGILAGGVAHDFNNLLVGILGNTELAMAELPEDSLARDLLTDVGLSAQRAAEVTNQLLAYSGRSKLERKVFDLSKLAEETIQLLQCNFSRHANLKTEFAHKLPAIEGDPSQIRQMVMNLLINASDALCGKAGEITVTTGHFIAEREMPEGEIPEGDYSYIEISDTGCGMSAETQEKIFDPFFSTHGLGRGLGLAALQGIVSSHNGFVKLSSEQGHGTTFSVFFPTSLIPARATKARLEKNEKWTGSGTVLIVDDEALVRKVIERNLTSLGLDVLIARDGIEAVQAFSEHYKSISVVLLDLTMPRMGGKEALNKMRSICTSTPIILTSGFNPEEVAGQFSDEHLTFLHKPYVGNDLIERVREALEA